MLGLARNKTVSVDWALAAAGRLCTVGIFLVGFRTGSRGGCHNASSFEQSEVNPRLVATPLSHNKTGLTPLLGAPTTSRRSKGASCPPVRAEGPVSSSHG